MSSEVEISFNLNHPLLNNALPSRDEVIRQLKRLGAKKEGTYLFQVVKFIPPNKSRNVTLRIRNEGRYVTMTYKHKDPKTKYKEEHEVVIDNFATGIQLLQALGATENYFYEKIREIWVYKDVEIVFDDAPGLPPIMEIECKKEGASVEACEKVVWAMAQKLGISKENVAEESRRSGQLYQDLYGFELHDESMPFSEMKNLLGKKCKKNKGAMMKIIRDQLTKYKKLVKK